MEIVVLTNLDGLASQLEAYDLTVTGVSKLDQVERLVSSAQPPQAVYLDDTRSGIPPADMWRCIAVAQQHQVPVLVNFVGVATSSLNDAVDAGIPVTAEREVAPLAAWVGQQLGVSKRTTTRHVPVVAVGAAKGGIGKTLVVSTLAEALRRRGLRVLVWDSDIANPGIVPLFRVPTSAPSYLHLVQRGPQSWTIPTIQQFVHTPEMTRATAAGWGVIDLLVGSHAVAKADDDVLLPAWQGLYSRVVELPDYDILLIDTSPDYLKRPYPTHVLQSGGYVVLPAPPGNRERMGVGNMLDHLQTYMPARMDRCLLVCSDPEKGATFAVKDMLPIFQSRYPQVRLLGTLPRAPRIASLADEHDGYMSMLDIGPDSPFAQAAHRIAESLAMQLGIPLPLPRPQASAWARLTGKLRGDRVQVPDQAVSLGQLASMEVAG